jgi:NAD(P)-dependent dehydrogenase (short-subunit alcohol dehydrogenase family)
VALITGGGSGLGLATARRLARHGIKVAMLDMQARADVKYELPEGLYLQADVTSEADVRAPCAAARVASSRVT